jgi:pSer/pThr/pTyr-binding forkhead associated (FHA) protein
MARARAKLILHEHDATREVELSQDRVTVGRSDACDVTLREPGVSGHHLTLVFRGGYYFLKDEGSTNGTFVEGRRTRSLKLRGGEHLRLGGEFTLEYQLVTGPTRKVLRLVPAEGGNPVDLKPGSWSIGREASCDIQIRSEFVSRRHALLTVGDDGGISIQDEGSSQGTFVNGRQVNRSDVRPGDRLRFADQDYRLAEEEVALRQPALLKGSLFGVGALVLLAVIAFVVYRIIQPSELERIGDQVQLALVNYDRDNTVAALEYFDRAVTLLEFREDVEPYGEREEGFSGFDLVRPYLSPTNQERDLDAAYDDLLAHRPATGHVLVGTERRSFIESKVTELVQAFGPKSRSYTPSFVDMVEGYVNLYLTDRRKSFHTIHRRGMQYLPTIREELHEGGLPEVFAYMPAQESAFSPTIKSGAGARGLWQFMPATAREMGLEVNGNTDERTDPAKSTRAAVRYIKELCVRMGVDDYLLALAAYNWGFGNVQAALVRVMRRAEDFDYNRDRNFWYLVENDTRMPKETKEYVARIFAFAILLKYPDRFGF